MKTRLSPSTALWLLALFNLAVAVTGAVTLTGAQQITCIGMGIATLGAGAKLLRGSHTPA